MRWHYIYVSRFQTIKVSKFRKPENVLISEALRSRICIHLVCFQIRCLYRMDVVDLVVHLVDVNLDIDLVDVDLDVDLVDVDLVDILFVVLLMLPCGRPRPWKIVTFWK